MVSFNLAFAYACAHSVVSDSVTRWTICSLPVSVHGIFQARILEWVAISSSTVCSKPRDRTHVSCIGRQILYHWCHLGSLALGLSKPASPTWWWWSVVSNSVTPWTATHQASLSFTISWSLLKLMSIESVMPSNHLILCHPLLPSIFANIRVFSYELALRIRWPTYWSFSFGISPSNEYSGLSSFMMDRFTLLAVQGTLKSLLQHHSLKASILWCSANCSANLCSENHIPAHLPATLCLLTLRCITTARLPIPFSKPIHPRPRSPHKPETLEPSPGYYSLPSSRPKFCFTFHVALTPTTCLLISCRHPG